MPVISKKYFRASSPSVFGPYIIGIQSDKYDFLFLMLLEYRAGHLYSPVNLLLFFFTFSFFQDFKDKGHFIRGETDSLFIRTGDQCQHDGGKFSSGFAGSPLRCHPDQFQLRRIYILHCRIVHPFVVHRFHLLSLHCQRSVKIYHCTSGTSPAVQAGAYRRAVP